MAVAVQSLLPLQVLNALRHQRGKQIYTRSHVPVLCPVLNALRHQRGKQLAYQKTNCARNYTCSTPCGIRGENKNRHHALHQRRIFVLNALRHQRGKQSKSQSTNVASNLCSTPCGIRGENKLTAGMDITVHSCAQRLAASEGKTKSYGFWNSTE